MFGFSLTKLLLTVAIIAAIWYGFKYLGRIDRARKRALKGRKDEPGSAPTGAESLVKCPVCGTYVAPGGVETCGREDCPYGG